MKESKFIELLNLYVDREISREESILLEQEVANNPERMKVYQQYCRMHRATAVMAESFKAQTIPSGSKLARAAREADSKIARSNSGERTASWSWGWFSAGSLAVAAACVALVVVNSDTKPAEELHHNADLAVRMKPAISPKVEGRKIQVAAQTQESAVHKSLVKESNPVFNSVTEAQGQFATAPSMDWMKKVNLPTVQTLRPQDLNFEGKQVIQPEPTDLRSPQQNQGRVEMTAFQFQK